MYKINSHEYFMSFAIEQAKLAKNILEVPVGAVIVRDNKIISTGYNLRETKKNALYHAEIIAINNACEAVGGFRITNSSIYITLEPCPMCMGAIINARIDNIYFGAYDKKSGCCESVINFNDLPFNHKPIITGGILLDDCSEMISSFFRELRKK